MSAAIMNPVQHRKPLPGYTAPSAGTGQPHATHPRTVTGQMDLAGSTSSSQYNMAQQQPQYGQYTRRTPSNATSSSSGTTNAGLQRVPTTSGYSTASAPRRSTSSRSTSSSSPTSYVALMRKQKATVWCDRAQHEDPRILAAQRAAKTRAAMEVAGGHHNTSQAMRTSTSSSGMVGGVRSKIRHHGAPKASTYTGGPNLGGVGVPMRLSASEVDEGDSDDEAGAPPSHRYHSRTGSGRSSVGSGHHGQYANMHSSRAHSTTSTPSNGHSPVESMGDLAEEDTPMQSDVYATQAGDYFQQPGGHGSSGSSGEETRFGGVGGLPHRTEPRLETKGKGADELQRRGSVDDRTMTMSAGRLFVANPDLSD
ncbi:hypothetical protein LTR62_001703 [Meristemomyces frigidus]|uniref:Uncharacterized protein n=1 Tax=Meristemomyces frigidus TaxID=1508187 RepID=A0AAN7T8T9_9PEZI|nr:hypothetical protein LTR62_001703 [Meristemomyces frigidus]